jgi:hypothetical protein
MWTVVTTSQSNEPAMRSPTYRPLQSLAIIGQRRIVYSQRGTMYRSICTSCIVQKGQAQCRSLIIDDLTQSEPKPRDGSTVVCKFKREHNWG